jgi:hypothetical protein
MYDLTKIDRPFGLLDEATQKALRECGGPWEYYGLGGWLSCDVVPDFYDGMTYRQKPKPPKPRDFWLCADTDRPWMVLDRKPQTNWDTIIHVREVIE